MSTAIWPPAPADQLEKERQSCLTRELEWLLSALQETLQSIKAGLEECSALLAPRDSGSTLVLSSQRSESLKGFVTLNGARITKGDIHLRMSSLPRVSGQPSYRLAISSSPTAPALVVDQLISARTLLNYSLDVVDATRWTGDANNAGYISSQLRLLHENVQEARDELKGGTDTVKTWHEAPLAKQIFDPPLPGPVSLHFAIADAGLVFTVRTLEPAPEGSSTGASTPNSTYSQTYSGLSIRDRLAQALGAPPAPRHDEADEVFTYRNQLVKVREKLKIETQDPSLMAALAKLSALEHTVALSRKALDVVMGHEEEIP
ncbi:RAVE subunit 2/Rogdi [Elsinoe ampelina]|uniref:RAVE subunit 2/Rogdi n=1 Tax=Elsinoe ampelina TaxID=302913 RepID=A0A6A6GHY2_9PEZI|nr:RAVE subunit 2/Rogdi [Elsinoe ampelina]